MKKLTNFMTAMLLCVLTLTSCQKEEEKFYYAYENDFNTSSIIINGVQTGSDVSVIENVLTHKLNQVFELTPAEAKSEWKKFVNSIDDSKVKLNEGEYYRVKFCRQQVKGNEFVSAEVVGEKEWTYTPEQ